MLYSNIIPKQTFKPSIRDYPFTNLISLLCLRIYKGKFTDNTNQNTQQKIDKSPF